ncbi:MAG: PHB depolymerase family esterase [Pseudomonadota bacterium]
MPKRSLLAALSALCIALATSAGAGCGASPEPCEAEGGTYHLEHPGGDQPVPALIFLHGWGSSGEGSLKMRGMVNTFLEAGYAVIAPDGTPREGRNGRSWSFHPDLPKRRDEITFLSAVRDAAVQDHGIDGSRVLLSGFSIGGSMVSYLACAAPETFAAYAPVGGGFWRPHPQGCEGPVRLLHTHGWQDGTVPLEGRILRGESLQDPGVLAQGDIFHTLDLWRAANGCIQPKADAFEIGERYWRRAWTVCAPGSALEFALFQGGMPYRAVGPPWRLSGLKRWTSVAQHPKARALASLET